MIEMSFNIVFFSFQLKTFSIIKKGGEYFVAMFGDAEPGGDLKAVGGSCLKSLQRRTREKTKSTRLLSQMTKDKTAGVTL